MYQIPIKTCRAISERSSRTQRRGAVIFSLLMLWTGWIFGAEFHYPLAVAISEEGTVFVADRNLPGIWKVSNGKAEVYFRGSKKFRTPLNAVRCLSMGPDGKLYAGDSSTREVYRFDQPDKPIPLTAGKIGIPISLAFNSQSELLVADLETQRIWKVPTTGGKPEEVAAVASLRAIAVAEEDQILALTQGTHSIVKLSADGKTITPVLSGRPFKFPHQMIAAADAIYVSDGYAKGVWRVPNEGKPELWVSGDLLKNPVGLAIHDQQLYLADPQAKAVFRISPEGELSILAGPDQ